MRKYLPLLGLVVAMAAPMAHADAVSLSFTSDDGFAGGTGTLQLSGTGTPNGTYYAGSTLTGLTFLIDGFTYSLNPSARVTFNNGVLESLSYVGASLVGGLSLTFENKLDYGILGLTDHGQAVIDDGDIAAVPEPSTLAMFGTGLLGLAGIVRRKLMV